MAQCKAPPPLPFLRTHEAHEARFWANSWASLAAFFASAWPDQLRRFVEVFQEAMQCIAKCTPCLSHLGRKPRVHQAVCCRKPSRAVLR